MKTHTATITCPECGTIQVATIEETIPFWTYIHHCEQCKYIIQESEWEEIETVTITSWRMAIVEARNKRLKASRKAGDYNHLVAHGLSEALRILDKLQEQSGETEQ